MTNLKQRPLQFRAWNEMENKMVNVDVLALSSSGWDCPDSGTNGVSLLFQPHIAIMQFTGLTDKTGKDVYEGDIVKFRSHPEKQRVGVIRWHETTARFYISIPGEISIRGIRVNDQFEVIGNVHQHPELLEYK